MKYSPVSVLSESGYPFRAKIAVIASCLVLMLAGSATAQDALPAIEYSVDFSDAVNHYVTIRMTTQSVDKQTQLMLPTWTPGSYLVREYAKHIDRITASDAKGAALPIVKISKNRWTIDTPDTTSEFTVEYRLFCDELSVRTNSVERSYAVLNGAATFVTIPERRAVEHRIKLDLPARWKQSATSLRPIKDKPNEYVAADYDELVDSPMVAGNVELFPFVVADVEHFLVNVNDRGDWDGARATKDLAKVVAAHHRVWNSVPYDRYYFLNVVGNGGGGLEHNNSCLILSSRHAMRDEESYRGWLSLASHEFFHTWNVRRLRPKELVKYDYESEVYTPSLWVAEGVTSYYEDLLLIRSGLMEEADFISGIGGQIRSLQNSEGRKVQSLRDSSHDTWIKFYRPAANSSDTQISYYTKGAVVGLLLDARIRSATNGEKSLDDALRTLYQRHAGDVGYTPDDFRAICNEVAGADLNAWFANAIDSTDELDYQELADWFGLEVGDLLPTGAEVKEKKESDGKPTRWIGVGESGSPGSRAGLSTDDELIALNKVRLESDLESRLQDFEVGDPIELIISRDEQILEVLVTIGSKPITPSWDLKLFEKASDEQKARRAAWLDVPGDDASETVAEPTDEEAKVVPDESPDKTPDPDSVDDGNSGDNDDGYQD